MIQSQYHNLKKGVLFFLLSYLFIAMTYTFSCLAGSTTSVSQMVFFRNLVGICLPLPWMLKNRAHSFKVSRLGILILRSSLGMAGIVCVFLAVKKVSLVDVTLLSNTAPLFVPLLTWLFLRKPIDHRGWPAIVLGFVGVMLILLPTKGILNLHALYALGNGITTAATFLVVRLATKTEKMQTLLFYYYLIGFLLFLPMSLASFEVPDPKSFIYLVLVGVFAYYGSSFSFYGLQYAKTAQLAPFSYSGVVYAGIIQWLLWGTLPNWINLVGVALTCAAGIYILVSNKPSEISAPIRPEEGNDDSLIEVQEGIKSSESSYTEIT